MRKRTRARELALQFLYQVDLLGEETMRDLNEFMDAESKENDVRRFAVEIVSGTWNAREEIDAMIQQIAKNWDLRRMATIDRNILRMAIFELRHPDATPAKVVINEAIELGKRYSTQHSGKFINGILDKAKGMIEEAGVRAHDLAAHPELDEELSTSSDLETVARDMDEIPPDASSPALQK